MEEDAADSADAARSETQVEDTASVKDEPTAGEPEKEQVLVDRKVIDEKLIRESVVDSLDDLETGLSLKPEEIDLLEVKELSLSFKNIYSIDSIVGFDQLVKLQLDNNIIDKIQNLSHLVNLQWLDLSFNNITKIEGLDKLTNLTDLSLFNNQLTTIENLGSLVNLNVLSVGNNQITDLECIKTLRQFPNLRLLNMQGNPVCTDLDYKNTIFAHVTNLKYLDYVLIEASQISAARDNKLDELVRLESAEQKAAVEKKQQAEIQNALQRMEDANLGGLNHLIDWVISEDPEYAKLSKLPGYAEIIEKYRATIEAIISEFTVDILERHTKKEEEKDLFTGVVKKAEKVAEAKSIEKIQEFEAKKKKAFAKFEATKAAGAPDLMILEEAKQDVAKLFEDVMDIEMLLVEMLNDVMDEFDEVYMKMVGANVQEIIAGFNLLSAGVSTYSDKLSRLVLQLLEVMANEDAKQEDDPAVTAILSDRDKTLTSVATSGDNHTGKIMQRGDEVSDLEDKSAKKFSQDARQDEYERNRFRVSEIRELIKTYNGEIDQMLQDAQEEEDNNW